MRYLLIILILTSCNKDKKNDLCLVNLKYTVYENSLLPPTVTLVFKDEKGFIEKAVKNESFETIFFYSFEEEYRMQGYVKQNHYEKEGEFTKLSIGINYFNDLSKKDWSQKQIEGFLIKDGIGMIIGKDTIVVRSCQIK